MLCLYTTCTLPKFSSVLFVWIIYICYFTKELCDLFSMYRFRGLVIRTVIIGNTDLPTGLVKE